jgi:hypothetical protein
MNMKELKRLSRRQNDDKRLDLTNRQSHPTEMNSLLEAIKMKG